MYISSLLVDCVINARMSHTCLVWAFMPKKGSFIQHNVTDGVIIGRFIWSWMSNSLLIFRVSIEPFLRVKTHRYITLYFRAKCLTHASILIKAEYLKGNSQRSEAVRDGWIAFSDIFSRTLVWYLMCLKCAAVATKIFYTRLDLHTGI